MGVIQDLIVVGGGFWGVASALVASKKGMRVVVLDNRDPRGASRNAAGIVCKHWYKQHTITNMLPEDWTKQEIQESVQFLDPFGLSKTGEQFTSYAHNQEKWREDCYLIPSCSSLLSKFTTQLSQVLSVRPHQSRIEVVTRDGTLIAHKVLIAAGAFTDNLLKASQLPLCGVRALRGRAFIATNSLEEFVPRTHMSRPYTHYTLRPWGKGHARLGDTVEKRVEGTDEPIVGLQSVLAHMSPGAKVVRVLDGWRPVCEQFTVKRVHERIVVATGGHRVGLGLAGLVANKCWELLK